MKSICTLLTIALLVIACPAFTAEKVTMTEAPSPTKTFRVGEIANTIEIDAGTHTGTVIFTGTDGVFAGIIIAPKTRGDVWMRPVLGDKEEPPHMRLLKGEKLKEWMAATIEARKQFAHLWPKDTKKSP